MWAYFVWGPSEDTTQTTTSRTSTRRSSSDIPFFGRLDEVQYPPWWTQKGFISWYRDLPDDTLWNSYICAAVLVAIVAMVVNLPNTWYFEVLDGVYNISYAAHVIAIGCKMLSEKENMEMTVWILGGYLIDLGSYSHYVTRRPYYRLGCYYLRLHRPFKYLWSLYDYNLRGSILGTTLKYCYIFMVLRITWAWIWLHVNLLEQQFNFMPPMLPSGRSSVRLTHMDSNDSDATKFLSSLYIVNKMFIPIGMPVFPDNDIERVTSLFVILSGCVVVTGAAVATLSLVISLYMSPEETFRSRYRLIIKEMKESLVPLSMREKVQKFYHMYWHKQRAVSETQLLPTFPPTLPATVYTDIYFEATQKSRLLRELSYQFLSEVSKKMETIHYIPGDIIIDRNAKKCAIIFITYGDIEMLTAEDDITAILRFTRGTILTPCGAAAALAVSRSHIAVRAATFCTAHVLQAADLWRLVNKHSVSQDNARPILKAFTDHIEKVKRHYLMKIPVACLHKSSILHFNRNLMALKEKKDADGRSLLASTDVFLEIAGCYIMRNRLDSTLTDESDAICLRPTFPCILQPYSSLLMAWHCAVACLILIICITHPYYLVFLKEVPVEFRFFDYMGSAIFVVDHIVHLSTGAHVEEGVPITFAQTSSQQMRSKWFLLDVVGTLPIFEFIGDGHFAGINKILRLPKVFRLLKTLEDSWVYHSNVLRFCSYTLLLLIACYLVAAMQQAFMCYQSGYCLVTNFTHSPFWEEKEMDEETVMARLIFGLYWAISMIMFTTHMETWGKENMSNVMYTMIILEFCIVLKTFMEAVYSATIMVTTAMREDYDARIATVKRFLIRNEVDPELRKRFITYLQLCWYTDKAYKMTHAKRNSSIFYDLPRHVYQDIVGRKRIKYVLCIPFMKVLKKEELKQLASNAHLFYTSPNEILMNTGDIVNEMYVVVKGICEYMCPQTQQSLGEHTAKSHFGAVICLLRIPSYYTVRAVTHVQIFCISLRHLKPVFDNPQIKEAIEYLKTQPEYTRLQKGTPSFLKYEPLPPIPNTERFPLPRKHEHDYVYLHPFQRLGFLSILRYIFPRFTIRPDGKYLIRYEWFRVSCALLSAMVFPNYTYLVLQWPWLYFLTWLLDLSAMFDIFQRMLVAYYNEEGILVYHPSSTAAYYIKGPFIVDLIGCLALEKLESERIETYENGYRVTPIEQFLMMNRLLQLYRFPSIMQTLHNYIERQDIHLIIYTVPLFISIFNVLTCLMVFNSVKIFFMVDNDGEISWLLEPYEDKGGSWIYLFRNTFRFNLTSSPWNLYLATHFWVVYETTTTGYAKFKPSNSRLMEILFIGMAISAMLITYFSVRIISIRSNVNKPLAGFQQHMRDIALYMKREKLDTELQRELRCYYEYNWEKMGGIDYRGMLKLCNQITLRTDAILHIYGPTFAKCPLLAQCDVSLLRMIGRSVRSIYFVRDMKIVEYDDVVRDVYFVHYGGVESRVTMNDITQVVRLPRGSLFGNLEGTPAERVPMNIVATSRTHLLMINSQAFYHIIKDFPATKELMEQSRKAANKHYILGNMEEFKVKFVRVPGTTPFRPHRMDVIKYIYFQKGLIQLYMIIVSLVCIYMDLYNAGYQDNRAWLILTLYILDMCFFMKILMQFSLPLLVTKKNLKALLLPIRRMYFKREFQYDMISCVPIELLAFYIEQNRWFCFSWLRLNRMFRIVTVYNCLKRRNERVKVNFILNTILTVAVWFSVFVHATTCLWYFIGRLEEQAQPKSSWIYNDDGSSWCRNEYICSLYFIITTFTQNGVGDIMPKKQSEVIFVTILMIISTLVFMIYVGEFSNIIQYQAFRSFSFYSKYLELQDFLKNNRVSTNLVTIVNKYTLHLWRESRGMQVPRFLTKAPQSLRLRIMSAAYMHHISRHHIFQDCEPAFLRQLVGCLRLYTYNEEMFVVKEKEITNCMYVIHRGKVREASDDTENMILARVYPAGSCFGVGLVRDTPYSYSYQTMIKSQVLTLHLDDWEYLLAHFPQSKSMIHKNMGNLDKDMDESKWPGGLDPDYPPGTERPPTESETNVSNLPKFFSNKRITDPAILERAIAQGSMASTVSWISGTGLKDDQENGGPSSRTKRDSPPSIGISSSMDKIQFENEEFKEFKEEKGPKMGLLERITSTVMKLMGRYSDTELNSTFSEVREDLVLEEDATGALLKQLDEAMRLSRERTRKIKYRLSKDIETNGEDTTEKYMFTVDLEESQPARVTPSRTLRIQDDNTKINLHHDRSTASIVSDIIERAVDQNSAATSTAVSAAVAEKDDTETISNPAKKEIASILKPTDTDRSVSKAALDEGKDKRVSIHFEKNEQSVSTDLQSDLEIEKLIDTPAPAVDKQPNEDTQIMPVTIAKDIQPAVLPTTDSNLFPASTSLSESQLTGDAKSISSTIEGIKTVEIITTTINDENIQSVSDAPAVTDIQPDKDSPAILDNTAIVETSKPGQDILPIPDADTSPIPDADTLPIPDADTLPIPEVLVAAESTSESATKPSSDALTTISIQPDTDTQPTVDVPPSVEVKSIIDTPELTESQLDADTKSVSSVLEIPKSPDTKASSILSVIETVLNQFDENIQPVPLLAAAATSKADIDSKSIPDTSKLAGIVPDADTQPVPVNQILDDIPPVPDTLILDDIPPVPDTLILADMPPVSDTLIHPDTQHTSDSPILPNTQTLPDTSIVADIQPIPDTSIPTGNQPDADTLPIPDALTTDISQAEPDIHPETYTPATDIKPVSDNSSKTGSQPAAASQPSSSTPGTARTELEKDSKITPDTQDTALLQSDVVTQRTLETTDIKESHSDVKRDHPGADTQPTHQNLATQDSRIGAKTQPTISTVKAVKKQSNVDIKSKSPRSRAKSFNPPEVESQITIGTPILTDSQPDADTVSIPDSLSMADQHDADTQPVPGNLTKASPHKNKQPTRDRTAGSRLQVNIRRTDSQRNANTIPTPKTLPKSKIQPDADTQSIPESLISVSTEREISTPEPQATTSSESDETTTVHDTRSNSKPPTSPKVQTAEDTEPSKSSRPSPNVTDPRTEPKAESSKKDEELVATKPSKQKRKPISLKYEDDNKPSTSRTESQHETDSKVKKRKRRQHHTTDSPAPDSDESTASQATKPSRKKYRRSSRKDS